MDKAIARSGKCLARHAGDVLRAKAARLRHGGVEILGPQEGKLARPKGCSGKHGRIADHNAALADYQGSFLGLLPAARRVAVPPELRIADTGHRWGLSPFHYVEAYYREAHAQLQALGV